MKNSSTQPKDTDMQNATKNSCTTPFPELPAITNNFQKNALQLAYSQIDQCESDVQAWAFLADRDNQSDTTSMTGPLAGIPFGVKDVINVAGMPTRCGSLSSDDRNVRFHAACVEQLVRAGAIPIGKTVTAEYAFRHLGPTKNPWNLAHTPGGSSSGSAAAVAAGMIPLSLGTQTGGSIIRPAAYCGVHAMKPSYGLISRDGMQLTSESLDTIGWYAASMDWLIQAANILLPDATIQTNLTLKDARVSVLDYATDVSLEPEGRQALDKAIQLLETSGAQCRKVDISSLFDQLTQAHTIIMQYEFAQNLAAVARACPEHLSASLLKNVEEGSQIDGTQYLQAIAFQHEMRTQWQTLSEGADFILTPSAAGVAPLGHDYSGSPAFNKCWTLLGWPCVHIPTGLTARHLPVGVQLIGPWRQDATLLSYGSLFNQRLQLENPNPISSNS